MKVIIKERELDVLDKPLSVKEIIEKKGDDNYLTGVVAIATEDVIGEDFEGFLDIISIALVGDDLLMDIGYIIKGVSEDGVTLYIEVTGDVSNYLLDDEDDYDEDEEED
jgi:hypothetical protein